MGQGSEERKEERKYVSDVERNLKQEKREKYCDGVYA